MSIFRTAVTVSVTMAAILTPSAHAVGPGVVPWDIPICDSGGKCATPQFNTPERWTFAWGDVAPGVKQVRVEGGWRQKYIFTRYHPNRSNHPWQTAVQLTEFRDDGATVPLMFDTAIYEDASLNTVQCGTLNYAASLQGQPRVDGAGPGVESTPAVLHGCFPLVFDAAGHWIAGPNEPAPPAESTPAKAQSCPAIFVARKRVAVTSTGLQCSSARNVLARFMRNGTEPAGWVCSKLAVGRARSATCGTPGRAAKRIVGRWRV